MLDESTQECLMVLTPESIGHAVGEFSVCWNRIKETETPEDLSSYPWHSILTLVFDGFPTILSADNPPRSIWASGIGDFLKERNPPVYRWLQENTYSGATYKARRLIEAIDRLRDIADEAKHNEAWEPKDMPNDIIKTLEGLVREARAFLFMKLTKKTKFESLIHLTLKDVRNLHPNVYEEYQRLRSEKRGTTPFMKAIKQTVAYRYFSGSTGSFTPLCIHDIVTSPQFQAMSTHPKHQLVLVDMVDKANFLAGTRGDDSIETKGFRYTWGDCRVEVSEDTFYRALDEITRRGWFTVSGRQKMEDGRTVKLYVPSIDWKSKPLLPDEIARIQKVQADKTERIAKSQNRYRSRIPGDNRIESNQHTEPDIYNTQSNSV